ncbi:MAG: hypothetical protein EBU66_10490 [Bacteroidetes bacterium]|nr:hypothetical protein [Bacteroidota bacterium]
MDLHKTMLLTVIWQLKKLLSSPNWWMLIYLIGLMGILILTYSFYDRYDETYQLHFNMRLYGKSKIYKPSRGEVYTQFKVGTGGKGNKRYDFVGISRGSRIYLDKKNHFIFEI